MESICLDLERSFGDLKQSVLVTNAERTIVFANKAMASLLRVEASKIVGSTTRRFFADSAQFERMAELYQRPSDESHRKQCLIEAVLGDGSRTELEVVSAPLFDTTGQLSGLLFIAHDVSERKKMESRLSDVAMTLEDALDAILEGFAIYDQNDRLVICNENYREIYATSAPVMFPGNSFQDILRYGLSNGQYDTGGQDEEIWLAERLQRHQKADGSVVEQQLDDGRWLRISETRTRAGGIAGIRADITELKEAKALAEKAYQNLYLMADSISACVGEVDLEGKCLFLNKTGCKWFNGTSEELLGTRLREKLACKQRDAVSGLFREGLSGRKCSLELGMLFPDGVFRECQMDCNPRLNDSGQVDGLVVLISDITNRKKTERTLADLYAITSTRALGHEDKIAEILQLGCDHFDLPFGIISQVVGDHYTVTQAQSPGGIVDPARTFKLRDTYCAVTLEANEPVSTAHAAESEFASHSCYKLFGFETYIGAPLLVDGLVHGTISFTAHELRKRQFTPSDIQIIRQFADWIGHEIARQRDHQALMDAKIRMERIASIDDLTQIYNRRAFLERAHLELQRFRRTEKPFTAVMMDIDRFKNINDVYGHAAGDEVLETFSRIIGDQLRAADLFGRVGGEEFCVILVDTDIGDAVAACERLREKIVSDCRMDRIAQTITCSMGLAQSAKEDVAFSTLMQRADTALYEAKASGRNRCVAYSRELEMKKLANIPV
ncbi:diguanylate cyclase (GGDEF)-like protein/PAS domain S-box-containing protein [Labrenzia sp. EL_126]|nr:diguanylate cyclase (GGDEF)-like protein/PAS domain S-box-containing protein [Labrenzia sp. EL_126]